jgi:hypothetical protein
VQRLGELPCERRHLRARAGDIRQRLLHFEVGPEPRLLAESREVERLLLQRHVRLGNRQALLQGAHVDVVERHFGREAHEQILQIRRAGIRRCLGRVDAAANPAEQV